MPEGMIKARKRLLADEPSPPSHYIDVVNAAWETSKFPGIEHKVLYTDPNTGMATLLFGLGGAWAALAAKPAQTLRNP